MSKVKDWLVISEAKKSLGEEIYNDIKKDFVYTFDKLCLEFDDSGDINCKKIIKELRLLKNKIWIEGLCQSLGTTMVAVSLLRQNIYGLKQSIFSCIIGVLLVAIASLGNKYSKKEFKDKQDDLISYINLNQNLDKDTMEYDISKSEFVKGYEVACKDACDKLIQQEK